LAGSLRLKKTTVNCLFLPTSSLIFAAMKKIFFLLSIAIISGCGIFKGKGTATKTLWINSIQTECTDNPGQQCLQVQYGTKLTPTWSTLSSSIEGFTFRPGFIYKLAVTETDTTINKAKVKQLSLVKIIEQTPNLKEDGIYVHIETSLGDIIGKLAFEDAPLTVANFVGLAEGKIENTARSLGTPYYDSLIFHRVIPGFMIQGGDPLGVGMGGPGYAFKNETSKTLTHDKPGVFSMANSGPNTNGSQFFITHKATSYLDGGYNVFGQVVIGQEVVDAIGNTPRDRSDKPLVPVYMTKVSIIRVGEAAKKFDAAATFNKLK
jgi:cyclophilin family peptidyl-prolyl cis-trans isomerase